MTQPSFSVLVSSYNYQDFVVDAVRSALDQTYPPLEVIVVDDGSQDDSLARLTQAFHGDARVHIIAQSNQGQMTAWITGCAVAKGDVIALLDSDDLWKNQYLEKVAGIYEANPSIDYVYSNMQKFGAVEGIALKRSRHRHSRDLGLSVLMGAYVQRWQGVATSGNTLKKSLLKKILSLPADQVAEWKTRPDDCLFYGSDILGGHKYYVAEPLVMHREHAQNALLEFSKAPVKNARYAIRVEKMLNHYRHEMGISDHWLKTAKYEFRSKPTPTLSELWIYSGLALRAPIRWTARLSQVFSMCAHFLKSSSSK